MPRKQQMIGKITEELCRKYPSASTRKLAQVIVDQNPLLVSFDAARERVRAYRGEKRNSDGSPRVSASRIVERIPEPLSETKKPWRIEDITFKKALVIADVHVPFHDKDSLSIAIEYGMKHGCDSVIINGDFFDHYSESRFENNPNLRTFGKELEDGKAILAVLKECFPAKQIFKKGNHDERYEAFLCKNAPQLLSVGHFSFEETHGLDGWDVYGDKRPLRTGALYIIHGHEYKGGFVSPVNPARGIFIKGYECTMSAHQHQSSQHTGTSLGGRVVSCFSIGCLCHLHPQYMPLNQWQHGFATVEMNGEKFNVANKTIIKGKVY